MQPGWQAHLALGFERRGERTVLARRRHRGPLLVQRPFYPEGGTCHVYLVHPPGGIVGGDQLQLDAVLDEGAQALITTPAATKFYRSAGPRAELRQSLQVGDGASLEWLPQETIVFDSACADTCTRVELTGSARFIGWEVLCLGRPASGDAYCHGQLRQAFEVWRDGGPVFVERARLDGGSRVLAEPWGLARHPVTATLIASGADDTQLAAARAVLAPADDERCAATLMNDLLVCRYLGRSAERARRRLTDVWAALRPLSLGRTAAEPRIWRT